MKKLIFAIALLAFLVRPPYPVVAHGPSSRANEILQESNQKKAEYTKKKARARKLIKQLKIKCGLVAEGACIETLLTIEQDTVIVHGFKTLSAKGVEIFIMGSGSNPSDNVYLNERGWLIITTAASLPEIRQFLGLRPHPIAGKK